MNPSLISTKSVPSRRQIILPHSRQVYSQQIHFSPVNKTKHRGGRATPNRRPLDTHLTLSRCLCRYPPCWERTRSSRSRKRSNSRISKAFRAPYKTRKGRGRTVSYSKKSNTISCKTSSPQTSIRWKASIIPTEVEHEATLSSRKWTARSSSTILIKVLRVQRLILRTYNKITHS